MKVINFITCSLEPFGEILELKLKGHQVQIMVLWVASIYTQTVNTLISDF